MLVPKSTPGYMLMPRRGMGDVSSIQQQIIAEATAQGVDPSLALAVAQQESSFNPSAVSSEGAIGLFQLMPTTAAGLGVDPTDQTQNIQGGVAYLKQMLTKFGGDVSKALWAYNAGPGNVQKGIMPTETQNYVPSVLAKQAGFSNVSGGIAVPSDTGSPTDFSLADTLFPGADMTPIYVGLGLLGGVFLLRLFSR